MAAQVRFCGRCGNQLPLGAPFCGRCGAPQVAPAIPMPAAYSYPTGQRAAYPTMGQARLSRIAVGGGLLLILAIATVGVSAFAVSRVIGGNHSACTVNCAPKFVTPLTEPATFRSSAFKFEVDYSADWTVRSQDAYGISLGTKLGTLDVIGMKAGQPPVQVMQSTVSALPSATWQDVLQVSDVKGAHIGDQDGIGAVYSANLIGSNATAAKVRFAVIVATQQGVTVVLFAVDPADPKNSPHGMPESQQFDYLCQEFRWA